MKTPLIIGIDPGTTTGYAILGMHGNPIKIDSAKEIGLNKLIQIVMEHGLPVIAGTDKAKVPDFVNGFASKTGSKVIAPGYDLKVEEKKELTKEFSYDDSHQMDALASAIFALEKSKKILQKILKATDHNPEIRNAAISLVMNEGVAIKNAVSILENPTVKPKQEEKVLKQESKINYSTILKKERDLIKKDNANLRIMIQKLRQRVDSLKKKKKKQLDNNLKKIDQLFSFKEERIKELSRKNSQLSASVSIKQETIERMERFMANLNHRHTLKRLQNLGAAEYEAKKTKLKLSKGDILLVDDINVFNNKVTEILVRDFSFVLCKTKPSKRTKQSIGIELIHVGDLKLDEIDNFASIEKSSLDRILSNKSILTRIIEEYRAEKSRVRKT